MTSRRWVMLALGTSAQASVSTLTLGVPFLLPTLRRADDLSLAAAGALAAAPSIGMVATLIAWGALADRVGERRVLLSGLSLTAVLGLGAALSGPPLLRGVMLALVGAASASANAASGRLVMGWFARSRRGLAMGIRQMGHPLGLAVAGVALPLLARDHSVGWALGAMALLCGAVAVLIGVFAQDPPPDDAGPARARTDGSSEPALPPSDGTQPALAPSPYRTPTLWRVHAASSLLVVPQFATATFAAEYLVAERSWDSADAGKVLALVAIAGAVGRLAAGVWSDAVGSRLRPMRSVALAAAVSMLVLGSGVAGGFGWAVAALAAASVITVTDNGLGFTATAELAGRQWSGRALGTQNTAQNVVAFATGPLVGAVAGARGFGAAFAACALFPVLAAVVIPVRAEQGAQRH